MLCRCVDGIFKAVFLCNVSCVLPVQVQKPSNPWEFYLNTQLNTRMEPRARHLYNRLHAAHLFSNGSVLVGELHKCGTLLVRTRPVPLITSATPRSIAFFCFVISVQISKRSTCTEMRDQSVLIYSL